MEPHQSSSVFTGRAITAGGDPHLPGDLPKRRADTSSHHARQLDAFASEAGLVRAGASSCEESVAEQGEVRVVSRWVSMANGEQLHLRHLTPARQTQCDGAVGERIEQRIFMLHGEAESGAIFYSPQGKGLAHYFARCGYEVFVADLGGRGRSLAPREDYAALTVHDIVVDAIPRLLRAIRQTPKVMPETLEASAETVPMAEADIWMGHGFGGVQLAAAWARLPAAQRCATDMVFFGSRRQCQPVGRRSRLFHWLLQQPLAERLVSACGGFPAARWRFGDSDESVAWFRQYRDWSFVSEWVDADDGFDYRQALADNPLPRSLHIAALGDTVYAHPGDVRRFVQELGCHDARTVILDQSGSGQRYNHLGMLLDESAVDDVYPLALQWLQENESRMPLAVADCDPLRDSHHAPATAAPDRAGQKSFTLCA